MRLAYGSPEHQPGRHDDGRGDAGLGEPGDERAARGSRPGGDAMGSILPATTSTSAATTSTTTKSATAAPQGFSLSPTAASRPPRHNRHREAAAGQAAVATAERRLPIPQRRPRRRRRSSFSSLSVAISPRKRYSCSTSIRARCKTRPSAHLLAHPNPEQSAETRLFLPTDERGLVLKAAETADNTSQPSLLTKLETVSEPQLRLSSSEAVEGNSAGGVQLSGSPAANVVLIIVVAGNSQPATLQLGGDPNSPFTLPMSEGAAADQRLMNFGVFVAQDFSQSGGPRVRSCCRRNRS